MPLYHHYPSSPEAMDGCASRLFSNAGVLRGLMADIQSRAGLARGQVDGLLTAPMAVVDDPTVTTCAETAQGSLWAAGAVRFFAGSVRTFNDGVDQLNAEWDGAVADDFGVQPPYLLPTTSAETAQQLQADHTAEVSAARAARRARLDRLYAELEKALDDDATLVGGMLDRGPNPTDGARLFEAGVLQPLGSELADAYNPVDVSGGALFGSAEQFAQYAARTWVRYEPGRFRGPSVRLTPSGWRAGAWVPAREVPDDVMRASSARWATRFKLGGAALSLGTAAWSEWENSAGRPTDERVGRTVANSATVGGASIAGGALGAMAAGAALGSVVPGAGTVVGAAVGLVGAAIVGGAAGWVADQFNDSLVELGGDVGDAVGDAWEEAGDAIGQTGEALGDAAEEVGDFVDDLTPW